MELERHLVLNRYFLHLLEFDEFSELRKHLKDTQPGYDSRGRSHFVNVLISLRPEMENVLLRYDANIKEYVDKLRKNRNEPKFNLKYFQYLAVLFSEMFLDNYFNNKDFINDLNGFLEEFNSKNNTNIPQFTEENLRKLAFWMATGSGKTLIMHINYWQILRYSKQGWDNIILITPNEGLAKQHYDQLVKSGIKAKLYDGNIDNLKTDKDEILVIDIHKITKEKKGEGVSVDISYFDGKNLIFIDEGHKGAKKSRRKNEVDESGWKKLRDELGKNGFIFEYSATFGQIIEFTKGGKPKDSDLNLKLYDEYSKSIIFSYPYKYFYLDGYGKDFYVYNISTNKYTKEQRNLLLTAGLLSFYEQLTIFEKHHDELKEYNIEKPLWVFVGSKVTGKGLDSDIVQVVEFLKRILEDQKYLKETINKIFTGKTGLIDNNGNDIFKDKFQYIRELWANDIDGLINDIYQRVFYGKGSLELYEIKNATGELGLKTSISEEHKYFGVINVGDINSLKKLLKKVGIEPQEDHFSDSLFYRINEHDSSINILIGAKKFIEGWDSWRVSVMGLINMGKSEGTQIIQLFGRGVRLKGKDYSLQREENGDYKIKTLQTIYIFGLDANYLEAFLSALNKEDVGNEEIIPITIRFNHPEKWEGKLYTLDTDKNFKFTKYILPLSYDEDLLSKIVIDLRPRITVAHGVEGGRVDTTLDFINLPDNLSELIDWDELYLKTLEYKVEKGYYNLLINKEVLKKIVESKKYRVLITETDGISIKQEGSKYYAHVDSFDGVLKLNEIAQLVVKNYITKFYKREEKKETMKHIFPVPLTTENKNVYPQNKEIVIRIPKTLASEIKELSEQLREYNLKKIPEKWKNWETFVVHFDHHLYTPLVIYKKGKDEIKSSPVKLNEGETKFVMDLKAFLSKHKNTMKNKEVFLLRNLSRKGVGFFIKSGFYPDFIMWILDKKSNKQNIIFIDPKGIRNLEGFKDEKIQLCTTYIKDIEEKVIDKLKDTVQIQLDAFILSVSRYDDVKGLFNNASKEEFEKYHIIFQEDIDYIEKLFKKAGVTL